MSGLDTIGDIRDRRAAMRVMMIGSGITAPIAAGRLDDVWGPVGRRSGLVVAGFVLLLLSLGILLLDAAMNPTPQAAHGPDRVAASQGGAVTRVVSRYAGAHFELSQR